MRLFLPLLLIAQLAGCYTLNQERFAAYIAETVQPGVPLAQAMERLSAAGFSCDPRASSPAISCTRIRQSLLPYTCVERVNLVPNKEMTVVGFVAVPQVVCAGL